MFHRTLSALAVTLVGALSIAVCGASPALGADAAASRVGPQHSGVVSSSGEAAPSFLSLRPGGTVLAPGQSMTFEALYDTRPADSSDVIWESSDTSVFTVDGNGLVTAVGVGEAKITVTDRARSSVFGVSPVQVRAVPEDTGIELSSPSLTLLPGGGVVVNALLAPSLSARAVTWSLTPSTLATLTPNEGTSSASLSASARSGRGTLSATVTNESGAAVTASIEVEVEPDVSGDFVIEEDGTLTGYRGTDATVVIPEGVTAIASHAWSGTGVTSLRVPSSVRIIGDEAFSGSSLESLTFDDGEQAPSQLTQIGSRAFVNTAITDLSLPRSLVRVAPDAFVEMPRLTSLRLGPSVAAGQLVGAFAETPELTRIEVDGANAHYESLDGVLYTRDRTRLIAFPAARSAGGSYTIAEGVEGIDDMAFLMARVESVSLPSTLRRIGSQSFEGAHLRELTLPDAFEMMGASAFWHMPALTRVDLGGARHVSTNAFRDDAALREVNLRPDLGTLASVAEGAFVGTGVISISLPDSVVSVDDEAFAKMPALTSFHVGAALSDLGEYVLEEDERLATISVSLSNPTFSVSDGALYRGQEGASTLVRFPPASTATEVVVAPGTTAIGAEAFENSASLRRVVLPDGLQTIGEGAFDGCANLTELGIPDSVREAAGLTNTGLDTVELGSQVRELRMDARGARVARHILVRGGVDGVFSSQGVAANGRPESAFFGEGMTTVSFSGQTPRVLVLPATLTSLRLADAMATDQKDDTIIYVAAPEGTAAWRTAAGAMAAAGYEASHLLHYEAPTLTLAGSGIDEAGAGYSVSAGQGAGVPLTVAASGGTLGGREARLVEVEADGAEAVLRDWGSMPNSSDTRSSSLAYTWTPSGTAASLRVEVRDATGLVRSATLTLTRSLPAPTPASPTPGALPAPNDGGAPVPAITPHAGEQPVPVYPVPASRPAPTTFPDPRIGSWSWGPLGWRFVYADGGFPANTSVVLDAQIYRFDPSGYIRTGWAYDSGSWYYHAPTGEQVSGWVRDAFSWYYLDPASGAMVSGWLLEGGSWYYLTPGSGAMATGWQRVDGTWYYLDPASGAMVTGWLLEGGSWYYLTPGSGAMATGWQRVDGTWYYLDPASGAMVTGWLLEGGSWYYLTPGTGAMATGWQRVDGTWYRFADTGRWLG